MNRPRGKDVTGLLNSLEREKGPLIHLTMETSWPKCRDGLARYGP